MEKTEFGNLAAGDTAEHDGRPIAFILALVLLGAICLLAVAWIYTAYFPKISSEHSAWAEFGAYFGGLGGTIIAALALAALGVTGWIQAQHLAVEIRRRRIESLLEDQDEYFQRAFAALSSSSQPGWPNNSRLAWLTAARVLLMAIDFSKSVPQEAQYRARANELYWRFQFFHLLEPLDQAGPEFWATDFRKVTGWSVDERAPISSKSAKVIHDWVFQDWPDPMEGAEDFSEEEIEKLEKFRWRGLGRLLRQHREWRASVRRNSGDQT